MPLAKQILFFLLSTTFSQLTTAQRPITSTSFTTCLGTTHLTPSEVQISLSPTRTLSIFLNATNTYSGDVTIGYEIIERGQSRLLRTWTACGVADFPGICPLVPGPLLVNTTRETPSYAVVVDFLFDAEVVDAEFRFMVNDSVTEQPVGCVSAKLSNGNDVEVEEDDAKGAGSNSFPYSSWTLILSAIAVLLVSTSF